MSFVVTHRWSFDDGLGRSFARFNIDLYYCGGGCSITGDCGEIVARLCEVRNLPVMCDAIVYSLSLQSTVYSLQYRIAGGTIPIAPLLYVNLLLARGSLVLLCVSSER